MNFVLLMLSFSLLFLVEAKPRRRRESEGESYTFALPGDSYEPYPGRPPNNPFTLFPFTNQFNGGLEFDTGDGTLYAGELNVPIPYWGIFDIFGKFGPIVDNGYARVGHIFAPVNQLDLDPLQFAATSLNPRFDATRRSNPVVPVANLPKDFQPLHCRPPLCNPFTHTFGVGVEVDEGGETGFAGDLDFPIPLYPYGVGIRFPLGGEIVAGEGTPGVAFGHHLANLDPFLFVPNFRN